MTELVNEPNADPRDLEFLNDQINTYNMAVTGIAEWHPLAIFLREGGVIVAGVAGDMWGGYLEIKSLWVGEDHRGQGLGRRLLLAAEDAAQARGCTQVLLDTHDFQAPGFYQKYGYTVLGTFAGIGGRHSRFFMRKTLAAPGPSARAE